MPLLPPPDDQAPIAPRPSFARTADTAADGRIPQLLAWTFYLVAALGSAIGQIWVGADIPPWPTALPWWCRAALVTPFAIVIDLGGIVCAAFADYRRRLGETAYGWRTASLAAISVAVGINILGHRTVPYLSVVFGSMGIFAATVWTLHAAARRRDALRAAGKLHDTPPVYGPIQWWREPAVTARARQLATAHGYSRAASLQVARRQLHDERRRADLGQYIQTLIRAQHDDPIRAAIAVATLDIDAVADALTARADVAGWAQVIGADLVAPLDESDAPLTDDTDAAGTRGPLPPADVLRLVPQDQAPYDRWRQHWGELRDNPELTTAEFAARHSISPRQVQRIRSVGRSGLLDSPIPLLQRVAQLAEPPPVNGRTPTPPGHPNATA